MKFCDRPFSHVQLATKGNVHFCPWMGYTVGNTYEQDLKEIWHSEAAEKARATILDGSFAFCRKTSCRFLERDDLPDLTEEEIRERTVVPELPQTIMLCNDAICNIACTNCRTSIYCPEEGEREKIDTVLKNVQPYADQAETVTMNGAGEFLANRSFIEFLKNLHPQSANYHIGFETNGVLFDEEHWKEFEHLGKHNIGVTVTINSLNREVYRYLSGGFDHLDKVLDNMRFMSQLRREGKINTLEVTAVVQECNFWEVPKFIRTFAHSEEYAVDAIVLKPIYKWWHMSEETYWFKNILNPLHPYHKEYLKVLADDCWKDPKVYDWGCHNIREAMPHPLKQEEIYRKILSKVYSNEEKLPPVTYLKKCVDKLGAKRIGFYGKNEFSLEFARLLKETGVEIFQLTWGAEDGDGEFFKVAKQDFRPDMADTMLIIDFFKGSYWFKDLRALGFEGRILTVEELVELESQEEKPL